jgi:hypothetical protein
VQAAAQRGIGAHVTTTKCRRNPRPKPHDSQIFVNSICVNDKPRPITAEVLALMKEVAARAELENNRLAWQR